MPITISDRIKLNSKKPDLDSRYGPYTSIHEAYEALGEEGADVLCIGLTVGIQASKDDPITEYWFQNGISEADLIQKSKVVEVDEEFSLSSTNPVQNKVISAKIESIDDDIAQIKSDTSALDALRTELAGKIDEVDQSLTAYKEEVSSTFADFNENLTVYKTEVSQQFSDANAKIDAANQAISDLDDKIDAAVDELNSSITTNVSTLTDKISAVEEAKQDKLSFAEDAAISELFAAA